jgi:hypothetical protein
VAFLLVVVDAVEADRDADHQRVGEPTPGGLGRVAPPEVHWRYLRY